MILNQFYDEDRIQIEDVDVTERGVVFKLLEVIDKEYEQQEIERSKRLVDAEKRRMRILRTEEAADVANMIEATKDRGNRKRQKKHTAQSERAQDNHSTHEDLDDIEEEWIDTRIPGYYGRPMHTSQDIDNVNNEHAHGHTDGGSKKETRVRDPNDKDKYMHYAAIYVRKPCEKTTEFLIQEETEPMFKLSASLLFAADMHKSEKEE